MVISFLKNNIGAILRALITLILLLPLWLLLFWLFSEKRKFVIAIIDKTVLTTNGQEHISLNWVLNQERFSKTNSALYNREKDYYGFFPLENNKFQLKGLERFNTSKLDQLSTDANAVYITDAYGIYKNEWFNNGDPKERSGIIYGGMSSEDVYFMKQMRQKHKLIIAEFNCLASPTAENVKRDFENSFGLKWTGWIGRYFDSFDTLTNKEIPRWLINNYKIRHHGEWPFKKGGIAFIHADDRVVILENGISLETDLPLIKTTNEYQKKYGIPKSTAYPFWFDIIENDTLINKVIANFEIPVSQGGKKILTAYNIPSIFPAITAHVMSDYRFFYFSADFSDNPVSFTSSYFKGVYHFKSLLYNNRNKEDRKAFFWQLYQPLVPTILNDYYYTINPSN